MILHKDSHVDHVPRAVLVHLLEVFRDRRAFFLETITLPPTLGPLASALYGPAAGDPPVAEAEVTYARRPGREYASRLCAPPARLTRLCTVIAGGHDGQDCVLYTAFGGPVSPKEVNDPTLKDEDRAESIAFWANHALAAVEREVPGGEGSPG